MKKKDVFLDLIRSLLILSSISIVIKWTIRKHSLELLITCIIIVILGIWFFIDLFKKRR